MLSIRAPLGQTEAETDVVVTVQPLAPQQTNVTADPADWRQFVAATYGSCAGLDLKKPDDLPLQQRDWTE